MTAITEFLFPEPAPRRPRAILHWWERRRLHYNAIVGATGLMSLGLARVITWLPPDPHSDFFPVFAVVVFGVMANLCYLLGPMVEVAIEELWGRKVLPTGPTLYRMGLTFSVGLTFLPTLVAGFDWLFRIVRAVL